MQKILFIIPIVLITSSVRGQILPIDSITHQITYSGIVVVDSSSADLLFDRAKEWFVHSFNSANDVVQMEDKERKKIIGKGKFDVVTSYMSSLSTNSLGYVKFSVEIQAKEGRYRYVITDFWHEQGSSKANTPNDLRLVRPGGGVLTMGMKNWNGIKSQMNDFVLLLIKNLKDSMSKDISGPNDW
jgi:hypothetical protein